LKERLRVSLRPSRRLAALIAISHGAALAAAVIGLAPSAALVVGVGLALSGVHHLRIALHRSPLAVTALELSVDGEVAFADHGGEWTAATLRNAIVPAAWFAALAMRDSAGRRRAVVILPDAIEPDAFRRLRVWLLWRSATIPLRNNKGQGRR